jgi:hypothetical protein
VWVDNYGKTRAERVQVFATKLHRQQADGKLVEDKHFLPLNLRWSHSEDHPKIAAGNVAPIDKTVELNLTGNWFDEEEAMFRHGIGLRVVS